MTTAADIDVLLTATKTLAGSALWVHDERGSVAKLAAPLAEAGVIGSLVLMASATLLTSPQRGSCALVFEGRPIQRLSFRPDHAHINPFYRTIPQPHRGARLPPMTSRLHPWRLNRVWPRLSSDNIAVAEPMDPEPASLQAALTLFLRLCAIEGAIPPPPWEPRLL